MNPNRRSKQYDSAADAHHFQVTRGGGLIDFLRTLFRRSAKPAPPPSSFSIPLTRRERQVLELVRHGYTNREIAEVLGIAPETVKTHIANLRAKLGLATKTELRYWLLQNQSEEKE